MTVFENMEDKTKEKAWEFWKASAEKNSGGVTDDFDVKVWRKQFERYMERNYQE